MTLFALAATTAIVSYLHALTVVRAVGNTGAVADTRHYVSGPPFPLNRQSAGSAQHIKVKAATAVASGEP